MRRPQGAAAGATATLGVTFAATATLGAATLGASTLGATTTATGAPAATAALEQSTSQDVEQQNGSSPQTLVMAAG